MPDAEERMYAALAALEPPLGTPVDRQPANLAKSLAELVAVAVEHNDAIHALLKDVVEQAGGVYKEGPLKSIDRIEEKVNNDYKGNFMKLLDIVRGSAIFHSIVKFTRSVETLKSDGRVKVLRVKDRVTTPMENGYVSPRLPSNNSCLTE